MRLSPGAFVVVLFRFEAGALIVICCRLYFQIFRLEPVGEYAALAIPGGFGEFGFYEEAYDERFLKLIKEFNAQGKIIAAVCSGAFPVAKSGVLQNRKGTTYHLKNGYWQNKLKELGVNVVNEPVVVDGNIITSYCPETAPKVAFELLKMLTSEKEMEVIKKAMGF